MVIQYLESSVILVVDVKNVDGSLQVFCDLPRRSERALAGYMECSPNQYGERHRYWI